METRTTKTELARKIFLGVRQDVEGYKQLKGLLLKQRELMQRRDNNGLKHHNANQMTLCEHLMSHAKLRSSSLIQLGFSGDATGMDKLIARLPSQAASQVDSLWQQLLQLVRESQQANEANGKLLVSQQAVIEGLLNRNSEPKFDYCHVAP